MHTPLLLSFKYFSGTASAQPGEGFKDTASFACQALEQHKCKCRSKAEIPEYTSASSRTTQVPGLHFAERPTRAEVGYRQPYLTAISVAIMFPRGQFVNGITPILVHLLVIKYQQRWETRNANGPREVLNHSFS